MCDYSLQAVQSRPAVVGEKLVTNNFGTGTTGFAPEGDMSTAVCVLPGTELAFDAPIVNNNQVDARHETAIFRQVNKETERMHHDALEFPDGSSTLLTYLVTGQRATVLQLPAPPRNEAEVKDQQRLEAVG